MRAFQKSLKPVARSYQSVFMRIYFHTIFQLEIKIQDVQKASVYVRALYIIGMTIHMQHA